jgi:Peptidase family M28
MLSVRERCAPDIPPMGTPRSDPRTLRDASGGISGYNYLHPPDPYGRTGHAIAARASSVRGSGACPPCDSVTDADWGSRGDRWWSHIRVLASDELEGRATGSLGYARAADYVTEQFRAAGLSPAGNDGFRQPVDLLATQLDQPRSSLELVHDGRTETVTLGEEAAITVFSSTAERAEAEAVFVGYGLRIPHLRYDDFAGLDLRRKVVVFVRGGPSNIPGPVRAHYQSIEERIQDVRKAGAVGWVGIPNPKVTELPWSRLTDGLLLPRMELLHPGHESPPPPPVALLFNPERAEKLFAGSGHSFSELVTQLGSETPLPRFPLAAKIRVRAAYTRREERCVNVVGVLPGSDPKLREEHVVLSAHLDHLGIGEPPNGDRIYRGAMDNASGVASLLEIARTLRESGAKPKRSILFLALTAEEKGLLGSEYFVHHPTVAGPLVANINLDMFLPIFPLKSLEVQGLHESTLGGDIRALDEQRGIETDPEYEPDRVLFIRSDQYNFIKAGVPALTFSFGYSPGSKDEKLMKDWHSERYHGPADDLDQPVDRAAAARFNDLIETLLLRVANAEQRPTWNPESFFRRFAR